MTDWTLHRLDHFSGRRGPLVIVIMDGVGVGRGDEADAVALAQTPTLDRLWANHPTALLQAHGKAVGLPTDGDMGNSEVGHNAIGAGRVVDQGAKLVNRAISDGSLFDGEVWGRLMGRCATHDGTLHMIGLLSDGNVHSHIDQLFAMIRRAHHDGVERLRLHALLDGRDVPESSALDYVEPTEALLAEISAADDRDYRIASGGGRMLVTMDRYEADWSIVERGWRAHVLGQGRPFASASEAIRAYRDELEGVIDQFMPEFVIVDDAGQPVGPIVDGDGVVFFNFRGDRGIEISRAFDQGDDFTYFDRERQPDVLYAGMMEYDGDLKIPQTFLVEPPSIDHTMGEYLARNGVPQFSCSETQKYGHVTYFWNGNRGGKFDEQLETYVEVPSDRVPFEQRPWMKAAEVTDETLTAIASGRYRQLRLNYPNGDMVGHTGHLQATILSVEAVDLSLARLLKAVERADGIALITADHGNADQMYEWDKKKQTFKVNEQGRPNPRTSHSLNPVRCTIFDPGFDGEYELDPELSKPGLGNLAATCLALMGYAAPEAYLPSLIRFR